MLIWEITKDKDSDSHSQNQKPNSSTTCPSFANVNLKNIVKNEQKKSEVQQDYNQLYKWWEDNVSNFASDYQKWPGQGVN